MYWFWPENILQLLGWGVGSNERLPLQSCLDVGGPSPVPAPVVLGYSWPAPAGEAGRARHLEASALQASPPEYGSSWPCRQAPYPLGRFEAPHERKTFWSITLRQDTSSQLALHRVSWQTSRNQEVQGCQNGDTGVGGLLKSAREELCQASRCGFVWHFGILAVWRLICLMLFPVMYFKSR